MPSNLGEAVLKLGADSRPLDRDLAKAEQTTSSKLGSIGKTLTKTLTPAVLGFGAAILVASNDLDEAFATIRTGTGATGKALEDLKEDFKNVYGSAPGDSQAVASALAEVNTRLGLTGPALQKTTRTALEMADAMGVDATSALATTTQAMHVFGVDGEDAALVMDKMFVASQTTGIGIGQLSSQLQTFGPVLNNAGFSMDEATAILGQLNSAGVDASRVFPGLNAFFRKTAAAGGDLQVEFAGVVERMKSASTQTEALSIATEAFGAEGAQRMVTAVQNGAFELENLTAAMGESEGAIIENGEATRTVTERFEMMRREVGERLGAAFLKLPAPLQDTTAGFLGAVGAAGPLLTMLPGLAVGINAIRSSSLAGAAATKLVTAAQWAWNAALNANPIGIVVVAIGALIAAIVLAVKHWDTIEAAVRKVWNTIAPATEKGVNFVISALNKMTWVYREALAGMIDAAGKVAGFFGVDLPEGVEKFSDKLREGIPPVDLTREKLDEVAGSADEAGQQTDDLTDSVDAASGATADAAQSAQEYTGDLNAQGTAARGAAQSERELAEAIAEANTARREGAESLAAMREEIAQATERADELAQATSDLEKAEISVNHARSDRNKALAMLRRAESDLERVLSDQSATADEVKEAYDRVETATRALDTANGVLERSTSNLREEQQRQVDALTDLKEANRAANEALREEMGFTESEYRLAQARIRRMSSKHYAELLAEAEEYGERDLALFLLQTKRAERERANALQEEQRQYGEHLTGLSDALETGETSRISASLSRLNDYIQGGDPSLATLSAQERNNLEEHLQDVDLAQKTGDEQRYREALARLQTYLTGAGGVVRQQAVEQEVLAEHLSVLNEAHKEGDDKRFSAARQRLFEYLATDVARLNDKEERQLAGLLTDLNAAHTDGDQKRYTDALARLSAFANDHGVNLGALLDAWKANLASMESETGGAVSAIMGFLNSIPTEITTTHTVHSSSGGGGGGGGGMSGGVQHPGNPNAPQNADEDRSVAAHQRSGGLFLHVAQDGNFGRTVVVTRQHSNVVDSEDGSLLAHQVNDLVYVGKLRRVHVRDDTDGEPEYEWQPSGSGSMTPDIWGRLRPDDQRRWTRMGFARPAAAARGGIVPATPGGQIVRAGEGGQAEAIIPLPKLTDLARKLVGIVLDAGHRARARANPSSSMLMDYEDRVTRQSQRVQSMIRSVERDVDAAAMVAREIGDDQPMPASGGGKSSAMRPQFTVVLSGDLQKLGSFVRAQVLEGDIRGRQEVFYR